jgi:hypothetical protein
MPLGFYLLGHSGLKIKTKEGQRHHFFFRVRARISAHFRGFLVLLTPDT